MKNDIIKILIADDHPVLRQGLKLILEKDEEFEISAEAENGIEALKILERDKINIATLDIEMPGLSGFEVARKVKERNLPVKIVFLTMHKDEQIFNESMELGVMGYVLKENAVEDIVDCIKQVASGHYYLSPAISDLLIKRNDRLRNTINRIPSINDLTKTERLVLKFISENNTSKEIADKMNISTKTVENHRANISKKLKLHGTHSLIKFALSNKTLL